MQQRGILHQPQHGRQRKVEVDHLVLPDAVSLCTIRNLRARAPSERFQPQQRHRALRHLIVMLNI